MTATHSPGAQALRLLAILLVAICLIPTGAHLFEMASEMSLPPTEYMTVQRIRSRLFLCCCECSLS
jgi:hypothetical protein